MPFDVEESTMTRIDFGAHLHPPEVDLPESPVLTGGFLGPHHRDPDAAAEFFSGAGVDGAVLSQAYFIGHEDIDRTRAANDALLDIVEEYEQFYGLAAIPTAAGPAAAAEEFERCIRNGYNGGAIGTKSDGIELVDDAILPILEVADRHGAPLLLHPKLRESIHPEAFDETYLLNSMLGREVALVESICKAIHEGVLDEFEDLNLVCHHLGGGIANFMGIINSKLDEGRWPHQGHVKPFSGFKRQLEERIYLDTSGYFGYHAPIRSALEELPATQVLFGTDFPFEPRTPDEMVTLRESIEQITSESDAQRIFSANALELLINV